MRLAQAATAHRDTSVSALCRELGIRPVTLYRYVGPQGQLRERFRTWAKPVLEEVFGCGFVSIDINGEFQVCHNPRTMTHTVQQQPEALARLRLLVSVLGGAPHANWWRTEFLTVAGLRFLDRLYPRTSCAAAVRATGVAATELHDSNIGRGRVYHLFRLPEPLEGQLDALAGNGFFDQVFGDLKPILEAREALLAQFDDFAPELRPPDPGPQRIGNLRDVQRGHLLGKWAGAYLHAFQKEHLVFPYVEAERTV